MRLLVTGGAGFIGTNFILYWAGHHPDDDVVNLDSLTYAGNAENLKTLEGNSHYRFVRADICDSSAVYAAMEGIDTVVHFAAETHVDRSVLDPAPFVRTNIVGTSVLLEAARKRGIRRFHHISTDEVYGSLGLLGSDKFSETTRYDPRSPYSASKAASDHLVNAYFHSFGLPVTITNCSNNYGPFQFPEKLIPLAITNVLEGKPVPVYGDGKNVRDWLYVTDHVRAIEAVLTKGNVGETYCIGGPDDHVPNSMIVKTILKLMKTDESSMTFVKDRPGHDRRYALDWSKLERDTGWRPETDLTAGLTATISWYKEHTDWWHRMKSGAYGEYYNKQYGNRMT